MNAVFAEKGLAQLGIVFEQGLELAFFQQVFNGDCFAGLRGDQMHFRWNEGIGVFFGFATQRVEGFSDDLRRNAGDGQQDFSGRGVVHGRVLSGWRGFT